MSKTYPVGAFFVTQVKGPAGFLIALGQLLAQRPSAYCHAGMIVTADGGTIEAQPHGARPGHLADYGDRIVRVCDGPVQNKLRSLPWVDPAAVEAALRAEIARQALAFAPHDGRPGVGYSGLDYLALALLHLHLPSGWVRRRVVRSGRAICSQLVDLALRRAGIHLWTDDRLPGDVMPADLADWADRWEAAQ